MLELQKFSREEILINTLNYFKGDELATEVWINKYCLKDSYGNLYEKSPDDMHRRLAKPFADIENMYNDTYHEDLSEYGKKRIKLTEESIYNHFKDFKYISPQGSVMNVLANPFMIGSLSNCVVLPKIYDSYGGITYTDQQLAQLFKRRCGVGIDISTIRPNNAPVTNAAGSSTGAISYMERFSNTTREVGQCLIYNSLVLTKMGLIEIKDIKNNDYVWTRKGWVKVNKNLNNGKKETFKLITKRGYELIATSDHILLNDKNQETKIKDFKIGENVILLTGTDTYFDDIKLEHIKYISKQPKSINNLKNIKLPTTLNSDLSYLLGYSYGDGHFCYNNGEAESLKLSVSNKDIDTIDKLKTIILEQFDENVKIEKDSGDVTILIINSVKLCRWLEYNNINKEKTLDIQVPEKIMNSNSSIQMSFFSGYFDANGCAHLTGKNVRVTSISHNFIFKMQKILLANGIISNIQPFQSKKINYQKEYRLNIQGSYSQNILCKKSNSIKIKNMNRCSMQENIMSPYNYKDIKGVTNFKLNFPFIPISTRRKISISALNKCFEKNGNDEKITFIDEIVSIESYGEFDTNDLVLAEEHLFWCEGFYVHNSGRRGALMISIDVRHPDIEEFIKIKRDGKKVTGANISIRLTDDFMNAVENNEKYVLRFPVESSIEDAKFTKTVDAKYIWTEIIKSAHSSAEPGLIFDDRQHWYSTSSIYPNWKNVSTNPCSEIAMNNDSCRLMIVNYYNFVINPFTKDAYFDYDKLYEISYEAQRLMDDLVDLELIAVENILEKIKSDPEPDFIKEIEIKTWEDLYKNGKNGRRTGLGFTALGDTLAALGLKYDSDEALQIVDKISRYKMMGEFDSSIDMAIQRGKFVDFDPIYENKSHFINMLENEYPDIYNRMMKHGRRNISISTTAPTGSLSILTQSSSGIEPIFTISYKRRKKINPQDKNSKIDFVDEMGDSWTEFDVFHPKMKQWVEINNITDKNIIEHNHPYVGSTAPEIDWMNRIKLQSVIQKYVTHSISSCVSVDTLIKTNNGLFYIDELTDFSGININEFKKNTNNKNKVLNHNNEFVDITSFYNNGIKPVFKLTLDNGLIIKATGNEKLIHYNENNDIEDWKMISELEIGNLIKLK